MTAADLARVGKRSRFCLKLMNLPFVFFIYGARYMISGKYTPSRKLFVCSGKSCLRLALFSTRELRAPRLTKPALTYGIRFWFSL